METVELEAPPTPRSILVIKGLRLTKEQAESLQEQVRAAVLGDDWPVILAGQFDDLYWLPVEPPVLTENVEWTSRLSGDLANGVTLDEVAARAQEALEKAGIES